MLPHGGHELAKTWSAQEFSQVRRDRPAVSTDSPGTAVSCTAALIGASPTSTFERPGSWLRPKMSCAFGFRRSASISSVRWPARASEKARLLSPPCQAALRPLK